MTVTSAVVFIILVATAARNVLQARSAAQL